MNINAIKDSLLRAAARTTDTIKANSPVIMTVTGCVGVVGAIVLGCKASRKLDDAIDESNKELNELHHSKELVGAEVEEDNGEVTVIYSNAEYSKDVIKTYSGIAWRFLKLYGPTAALAAFSILLIGKSTVDLKAETASLASVIAVQQKKIAELSTETVETDEIVLDKDGNPKLDKDGNVKTKTVKTEVPVDPSVFEIIISPETTSHAGGVDFSYCDGPLYLAYQKELRRQLPYRRAVTLREVLRDIGVLDVIINNPKYDDLVAASTVAGWIFDPENKISEYSRIPNFGIGDDFATNPVLHFNCLPDITKLQSEVSKTYSPSQVRKLAKQYGFCVQEDV